MTVRKPLVCLLSAALICMAFVGLPGARAEVDISVGDYWEYEIAGSEEGMDFEASIEYKVASTTSVGGVEIFKVDLSGDGSITGDVEGEEVTGDVEFSGYEQRTVEDYDLRASSMIMSMTFTVMGMTVSSSFGMMSEFSDAIDNYIGNDDLEDDTPIASSATVDSTVWVNMLGSNESEEMTSNQTVTMTIVDTDVDVEVPAGTFSCVEVSIEVESDGNTTTQTMYYSEEVKNYVKIEGDDVMGLGVSAIELTSYSGKGGLLSNPYFLLLIVLVAIIVVAVVISQVRKRKAMPELPGLDMDVIRSTEPSQPGGSESPPKPPSQ